MIRAPRSLALLAAVLGALLTASCFDPVHSDNVAALGGEKAGVRTGPTHRPGQPCLVCHGGSGPGSPEFEIAGTIFVSAKTQEPAEGVRILLTDVTGKSIELTSNRAGNFYLEKDRESLYYPLTVLLQSPLITDKTSTTGTKEMLTPIGRNGGCATCHIDGLAEQDKTKKMGHVYLNAQ